jgi:hypothetical protein
MSDLINSYANNAIVVEATKQVIEPVGNFDALHDSLERRLVVDTANLFLGLAQPNIFKIAKPLCVSSSVIII